MKIYFADKQLFNFSGVSASLLTRSILGSANFQVGIFSVFTESLRSPEREDLLKVGEILPQQLVSAEWRENLSKFTSADKFKDNIYV